MTRNKTAARRTFWWTVLIVLVAVCALDLAVWTLLQVLGNTLSPLVATTTSLSGVTLAIQKFYFLERWVILFGFPGTFILFLLVVGMLRLVYRPHIHTADVPVPTQEKRADAASSAAVRAEKRSRDQRLFLHLISVLQREGRLIDFFAEDLSHFEDAQIGAAVREIHATCREAVEKTLSLKPVINNLEGETVSVEPGFDPGAVKLVGNVSGDPPFSGVLRHRGWQAGKMEVPSLSSSQDPSIIAPAEVEIL